MDIVTLAMLAVLATQPYTELRASVLKQTAAPARATLVDYQQMITKDNYSRMGFETEAEAKTATLGEPLLDYFVELDGLRTYQSGTDPATLLKSTGHVIYPVEVNAQARSSLTLAQTEKGWSPVAFGSPVLIRSLTKLRAGDAVRSNQSEGGYFSVRIPAFNLYLLGYQANSKLMLAPVFDDPRLELKAGKAEAADVMFMRLKPAALEHDGLPR